MKFIIKSSLLLFIPFINIPELYAVEISFKAKMEKCVFNSYCTNLTIQGDTKKYILDTGWQTHSFFYEYYQDNPYLKKLYENAYVNKNGDKVNDFPIKTTSNGYEIKLWVPWFKPHYKQFKDFYSKGYGGFILPQLMEADYIILDFKNNEYIGINGNSNEVKAFVEKYYKQTFYTIHDVKRGKLDALYIPARVNNSQPAYFMIDTGARHSAIYNGIANSKKVTGNRELAFVWGTVDTKRVTDLSIQIGSLHFKADPYEYVYEDQDFFDQTSDLPSLKNVYGLIGLSTLSSTILVLPSADKKGPIFLSKFKK